MPRSAASAFARRLYGLGGPDQPKDQANATLLAFVEMSDAEQRYVQVHLTFLVLEQLEELNQRLGRVIGNQVESHKRLSKRLREIQDRLDDEDDDEELPEEEELPQEEDGDLPEEEEAPPAEEARAPALAPAPAAGKPGRRAKAPPVEGEVLDQAEPSTASFVHPPAAE